MDKESKNTIELPIPEEYGTDLAMNNNLKSVCEELERQLTLDGRIGYQDRKWHCFAKSGEALTDGAKTIYDLILQLSRI